VCVKDPLSRSHIACVMGTPLKVIFCCFSGCVCFLHDESSWSAFVRCFLFVNAKNRLVISFLACGQLCHTRGSGSFLFVRFVEKNLKKGRSSPRHNWTDHTAPDPTAHHTALTPAHHTTHHLTAHAPDPKAYSSHSTAHTTSNSTSYNPKTDKISNAQANHTHTLNARTHKDSHASSNEISHAPPNNEGTNNTAAFYT